MKKKRITVIIIFLLLISLRLYMYINKPISILDNSKRVEQISLYDFRSEESVDIIHRDKIDSYLHDLESLKLKRKKLLGNSSIKELMIILYDESGETIDTLYLSEKEIVYHHWLVKAVDGRNPYEKIILEFNK